MSDPLSPEEAQALREELARLESQQQWITTKAGLREVQYQAAEIRWRLGLMSDEAFAEFEEFYEGFSFDG